MPTVSDAFSELLRRIELNPSRVSLASTRYNAVKNVLERELADATIRQIGSFQRRTKTRPFDLSEQLDVDAVAVLGETRNYAAPGQGLSTSAAIEKVRRALSSDRTYRLMEPTADAPVVVLEYADAFKMEVAVGFVDLTGTYPRPNGPPCYLVAAKTGWIPADYDYDANYISAVNREFTNETLVPLIKLAKRTFRSWRVPVGSFHTELLVATIMGREIASWIAQGKRWGYQEALSYFLANAHRALGGPVRLPGSFSPAVDSGLSTSELANIGTFLQARANEALTICQRNDPARAINEWRSLLGEPFPALSSFYGSP